MEPTLEISDWIKWILLLYPLFNIVVSAGSTALVYAFKSGKEEQKKIGRLNEIEKIGKEVKAIGTRIEDIDKVTMKRQECIVKHTENTITFCKKVDDIHHKLQEMERSRETIRTLNEERWIQIFNRLGAIEGHLLNFHRTTFPEKPRQ